MSTVKYAQGKLPPLTEAQRAELVELLELAALAQLPDASIDYGDIPPLPEKFWLNAVRNPFFRPTKTHATVRIDSDVMLWLKSQGKGYQTRLNSILQQAMLDAIKKAHG